MSLKQSPEQTTSLRADQAKDHRDLLWIRRHPALCALFDWLMGFTVLSVYLGPIAVSAFLIQTQTDWSPTNDIGRAIASGFQAALLVACAMILLMLLVCGLFQLIQPKAVEPEHFATQKIKSIFEKKINGKALQGYFGSVSEVEGLERIFGKFHTLWREKGSDTSLLSEKAVSAFLKEIESCRWWPAKEGYLMLSLELREALCAQQSGSFPSSDNVRYSNVGEEIEMSSLTSAASN